MPTKKRRRLRWYETLILFATYAVMGTLGDYLFYHQLHIEGHIVGGLAFATFWTLIGFDDKKSKKANPPK